MALPIYATITGKIQGKIKGGVTRKGFENLIEVEGFNHSIVMPVNPSTGEHQGRRVHHPVAIVKATDVSTPLLYKAMVEHEQLKIEFQFWKQDVAAGGHEVWYHTVELTDATVISLATVMRDITQKDNRESPHMDEVAFAYHTIHWTNKIAKVEAMDSHDKAATG